MMVPARCGAHFGLGGPEAHRQYIDGRQPRALTLADLSSNS